MRGFRIARGAVDRWGRRLSARIGALWSGGGSGGGRRGSGLGVRVRGDGGGALGLGLLFQEGERELQSLRSLGGREVRFLGTPQVTRTVSCRVVDCQAGKLRCDELGHYEPKGQKWIEQEALRHNCCAHEKRGQGGKGSMNASGGRSIGLLTVLYSIGWKSCSSFEWANKHCEEAGGQVQRLGCHIRC